MAETDDSPGYVASPAPEASPTGGENKLVAGLCYFPFMFINWISILYILIAKKDWEFGRFHAAQAAVLNVSYSIAVLALVVLMYVLILLAMSLGLVSLAGAASSDADSAAFGIFSMFFMVYGSMFVAMLPMLLFGICYLLYSLYLAFRVASGGNPRVPKLAEITDGLLGRPSPPG